MRTYHRFNILIMVILVFSFSTFAQASYYSETIEIFKKSSAVQEFLNSSYGTAVFPNIGNGGIGIGGSYGKDQVYENGKITGAAELFKATIGFQLGGQVFSEIIFFQDKRAYDDFTSGGAAEFDATAYAVAITAGAQAKIGTEGASAGASVGPATGRQAKKKRNGCIHACEARIYVRSNCWWPKVYF